MFVLKSGTGKDHSGAVRTGTGSLLCWSKTWNWKILLWWRKTWNWKSSSDL